MNETEKREMENRLIDETIKNLKVLDSHYLINGSWGGNGKQRLVKGIIEILQSLRFMKEMRD